MAYKEFEINKIRRLLKTQGHTFTFRGAPKNEYGEPTDEKVVKAKLLGVYHEVSSRMTLEAKDGSQMRSLPKPCILCLSEDLAKSKLSVGDEVTVGGNLYTVQGAVNIQQMGVATDISLKMVEDNGLTF